ncbi:uncharacterized protein [Neodiprion pinetum]|uniref:Glycosyltransferase family 92 protein n=1 Tax=Neodiprion lecontei TaxID=441921 RepID=A0A6J0BV90_NEOLC|nr:uncharacterized protein LOC107223181 [Neodiprion lecontei]XP_046416058.1 uncharacterized protein LOC124177583 [Neodiprion fabricii]XP_046471426.1 uncharacterized protein LOC124213814 [Neodiprion pinetum]XP_046471428.1 uncharacterized protein LOC124213814 [Neodiprion pinetum]XP_046589819.1 uncharacterized protein LOC107223181 [Neodiprion lecontei]XP_046609745.1 uncharacterized protein LOC124300105 [Neodiprion virginianus]XP_046609746.1 uncharacterized protein LOC124300105 [Neodiprion virgin
MLQPWCSGSARCVRKALFFVFIWGLIMIAAIQFRHMETVQENVAGSASHGASLSSGRFLLQQLIDSSYTREPVVPVTQSPLEMEPLLDKTPSRTEDKLIEEIETRLPSLPLAYWNRNKNNKAMHYKNESCAKFPSIFDLEFNNIYWQSMHTSNGSFQLFGAFYDTRELSKIGPAVRIVGMINRIEPTVKSFCQIWYEGEKEPQLVETFEYKYVWYSKWGNYKQGIYQPYIITCRVPQSHHKQVPASVSLVPKACDTATNNLRVIYNKPPEKKDFAVCVKGLDFLHEDLSVRLVEWIEMITLLGADKIFFYELQVHPNISKVLNYYEKLGKIHVTPLTLPGGQPNVPAFQHMYLTKKMNHKRQNELIPYNDCLYKHMYEYEYIALLDIDEVIMPVQDATWRELMDRILPKSLKIRNESRASYNVRNVYFLDDLLHSHGWFKDVPRYMHMLQHVYRAQNFTKPNQYVKCFHNPERVVTLHNHFPLACLGSGCTSYPIETEDAQLQHYRADCVKSLKKSCVEYRENSVMDTTIWRYKNKLIDRVTRTLKTLGFFGPGYASER